MQGIFRKENTDKALKYGIYRHLPTYEKIIRNLVSFLYELFHFFLLRPCCFYGKIYFVLITNNAAVAELVDALDSKSSGE